MSSCCATAFTRSRHLLRSVSRSAAIRARTSGVAHRSNDSSARQLDCTTSISTSFPFARGSHASSAARVVRLGRMTTSDSSAPLVGGLYASIVPSSVRSRGDTRSTCVTPRFHPRQVPYCSSRAGMPQDWYFAWIHFCALESSGLPVRRGPMESMSVCASGSTRELSMPSVQMRRSTGSVVGKSCASRRGKAASIIASTITIAFILILCVVPGSHLPHGSEATHSSGGHTRPT